MNTSPSATGYNDPPEAILANGSGSVPKAKGKIVEPDPWDYDTNRDFSESSPEENDIYEQTASDEKKPPKRPRNRRLTNASTSSTHLARDKSESSSSHANEDGVGGSGARTFDKARYPVHPTIPVGLAKAPSLSATEEGRQSEPYQHRPLEWNGIHAIEHEIEDTLFRGSEVFLRYFTITIQQVDVLPGLLWVLLSAIRH
ncbi:hypothetical protein QFC19_000020 [Naganishia cerealis]|uniref:Uncharacterized protein n=1 Tax=Naganishia cerealis TaxID=610337 RepID=A0ACC2WQB1_9TREE|nr:hypothetical protein QFC19_000020 [Naganishia cerealis]